jgi:hypothetical protein
MNTNVIISHSFINELEKIGERKKGTRIKRIKSSFRRKKKSIFNIIAKYPVFEAVGSAALTTKGLHLLASGGMFGKKMRTMSTGKGAGKIGALGLGIGTTYLGAKGIAGLINRL